MSERKFNYILLKMGYSDDNITSKVAVVISDMNVKVLVGEFKILLDRMINNIKLTKQEYDEHIQMIKKWEADLY